TQVHVAFKHRGLDRSLDPLIAIAVYRMVQEALTNVARYAQVGAVSVAVWTNGHQVAALFTLSACQSLVGATGIEPVSEAYKVSALTIVLHADGASGGQRSRSLRDVSVALCQ